MQDDSNPKYAFPSGLRVYLRSQMPDGSLHFADFPQGRNANVDHSMKNFLSVIDAGGLLLGSFNVDAFSFILPLETKGPGDAQN